MADDGSRSWNEAADDWVAHADTNDYRLHFLMPRMLALLGDVRGRRVLDLGCGEGGYARELASRGATVVAVDGSERLVEVARRRAEAAGLAVEHHSRNANALDGLADGDFDLVLAAMSLMDVEDYPGAIREAHRVLRPGGALVMSITHPCFTPHGAHWLPTGYVVDRYFDRRAEPERITARFRVPVLRRHQPLEDFIAAPLAAGFTLRALLEPQATEADVARSARFEHLTRIPYFMFLRWTKRSE